MPLQATSGAASYDAFGGGVAVVPNYIESCFATHLYTGNGSTQTITNGIDLAGKGGFVWLKSRSASGAHALFDTVRGATKKLYSNLTNAEFTDAASLTAFNSNGFSVGIDQSTDGTTYASWTFRKQPKFFDVVTYTGNGVLGRTVAHNLGSVPGCMIVKRTSASGQWPVYHRSTSGTPQNDYLLLNQTAGAYINQDLIWNNTAPTSTAFTVGSNSAVNANGGTYVAYLFAHNAGGFGLTGTDNVISCGSWTENGTVQDINLGYEPQFLLVKNASSASNWFMFDTMRGWPTSGTPCPKLSPNTAESEINLGGFVNPTATGFKAAPYDGSGQQQIYIAIRRGPMRVPTDGTKVFAPIARTGTGSATTITSVGFPPDLLMGSERTIYYNGPGFYFWDRLRGTLPFLLARTTAAESSNPSQQPGFDVMNGYSVTSDSTTLNGASAPLVNYSLRRAPGFFDEVCYTGTGSARTVNHNLGVAPELIIVKSRSAPADWPVYAGPLGATKALNLNLTFGEDVFSGWWNNTSPTSTQFTVGVNSSSTAVTYVAYLFASCPGVSKVFNYTGNGSSQTINCGFTGGARFVMIKRTDSTGDWYVWDTARGIVANNDPHLSLNTTAAEVTTNDTIDTDSTGFVVNQVSATNVNVNGASYIGLAIA